MALLWITSAAMMNSFVYTYNVIRDMMHFGVTVYKCLTLVCLYDSKRRHSSFWRSDNHV